MLSIFVFVVLLSDFKGWRPLKKIVVEKFGRFVKKGYLALNLGMLSCGEKADCNGSLTNRTKKCRRKPAKRTRFLSKLT